jgi:DNA-binding GntR family transcriptional regulator
MESNSVVKTAMRALVRVHQIRHASEVEPLPRRTNNVYVFRIPFPLFSLETPRAVTAAHPQPAEPARPADAYHHLRRLLIRGSIPPGTRVSEADLSTRLRVSRTPVREAMRRLLTEGLLVADGGGARPRMAAAPVGPSDVVELYQAAGALEGIVARAVVTLTPPERRRLAADMRQRDAVFRAATRQRPLDFDALFDTHDAFHRALHDACAGATIRALFETMRPRLDRYEWLYAPLIGPDFSATYAEHAAIVAAVREGRGSAAEKAVRANWFNGGDRLAAVLSSARELTGVPLIPRMARTR